MPDTLNFFDKLPDELCLKIEDELNNSDKSRFDTVCRRFFRLGFFYAQGQMYRVSNSLKQPHLHTTNKLTKQLLYHVVRGEFFQAENIIKADPGLLLEVGTVRDYSDRTIQGTALQIALGAEDVSYESKCNLRYIQRPEEPENTTLEFISKLHEINVASYVRCGHKLYYFDKINNEINHVTLTPQALKKFDSKMTPQFNGIFLFKKQLKQIKSISGHDYSEGMAEMIQRYMKKLPNGEEHITSQINQQFPKGWKKREKVRVKRDSEALNQIFIAIKTSGKNTGCKNSLQKFRNYLDHEYKEKGIIKTGKHFNAHLLIEALELYNEFFNENSKLTPGGKLFWRKVIGYIQRFLPACYAQAFCQHLYYISEMREQLRRDVTFRYVQVVFFPLDSDPACRLGFEYAVEFGGPLLKLEYKTTPYFSMHVEQKSATLRQLIKSSNEKNSCTMM
ncbi:MAG: hypothetical protein Q8M40_07500 [Legionella sp.]|nr:hypothetical protein [Legionella sp.]